MGIESGEFLSVQSRHPLAVVRARGAEDARRLLALARIASRDGLPHAQERARNGRKAARAVIAHARRLTTIMAKGDRDWIKRAPRR